MRKMCEEGDVVDDFGEVESTDVLAEFDGVDGFGGIVFVPVLVGVVEIQGASMTVHVVAEVVAVVEFVGIAVFLVALDV